MTKPKTEEQKQQDRMGRLHNKLVAVIKGSSLAMPETYVVIDNLRQSLLASFRQATGQDRVVIFKEKPKEE